MRKRLLTFLGLFTALCACSPLGETESTQSTDEIKSSDVRQGFIREYGLDAVADQIENCPNSLDVIRIGMNRRGGDYRYMYVPFSAVSNISTRKVPNFQLGEKPITVNGVSVNHICTSELELCEDGRATFSFYAGVTDDPDTVEFDERLSFLSDNLKVRGQTQSEVVTKGKTYVGPKYYDDSTYVREPIMQYGLNAHPFNRENTDLPIYRSRDGLTTNSFFESHFDDILYSNLRLEDVLPNKTRAMIICGPTIRTNVERHKRCAMRMAHNNGLGITESLRLDSIQDWAEVLEIIDPLLDQYGDGGEYDRTCGL